MSKIDAVKTEFQLPENNYFFHDNGTNYPRKISPLKGPTFGEPVAREPKTVKMRKFF